MPPLVVPACSSRVLAFFPHRRITGRVAFDGYGLVAHSATRFELRRFAQREEARLDVIVDESVGLYAPALVAIGTNGPTSVLARRAALRAGRLDIPTITIDVRRWLPALLGPKPGAGSDKLATTVTQFLPELRHLVDPRSAYGTPSAQVVRRDRSPLWWAAAAGIVALIATRPCSAAALLRGPLPRGSPLPALIAAHARRVHPTPPP